MAVRLIFIGGLGRSGTALLERLLGEVPGVAALGEVVHLWERGVAARELCGCGERFTSCPFWRRVGVRAFGGWSTGLADRVLTLRRRLDRTRHIPALAARGARAGLSGYTRAYTRVYEAAAEVAGAPVVVDSSRHASLAFCLRTSPVVDLSVVHVVRDPRAVAHSWRRRTDRMPDPGRASRRPWRTTAHWMVQNLAFELLARRGGTVIRVRYEDLVADPVAVLSALLVRLGLCREHEAEALAFLRPGAADLSVAHTCAGDPIRFRAGPLALGRDEAGCERLSRPHRWLVTALAWPLMVQYGYRIRDRRPPDGLPAGWLPAGVTPQECR
ncbi:sulfotransferase [Sphaerisporangium rufum]|uniref:Sulfotransferase n=1 Tax=Sphaerisporangium rufum TaxID=1381558 RepID=A0A919R181_9ACTN|nr:sulfotransferase [Sphaerisporangium rufum]GII77886.1 sulfotransferase [Sphaerisporangium rufum]